MHTTSLSEDDLNGQIIKLKTKTEEIFAIANSGIPMSFLNEKTARPLQENDKSTVFNQILQGETAMNFACYNGETIIPKRRLIETIESGGWKLLELPHSLLAMIRKQTS